MNATLTSLLEHASSLLHNPVDVGLNHPHTQAMAELLAQLTGISAHADMNEWHDIDTSQGIAISPVQAAKCLLETTRTQVFMQGVAEAISDKLAFGSPVNILYAGTGPYGLLMLPWLALNPDADVTVTLLDIHEENVSSVNRLVELFNIRHRVAGVVLADATRWCPGDGETFDLIVSETMNTLLWREPQVWIFSHLQQFLHPDGELIPKEIRLGAWLYGLGTSGSLLNMGTFFRLDRHSAAQLHQGKRECLSGTLVIPDAIPAQPSLKLTTDIEVYGDHSLSENQCSLNLPVYRHDQTFQPGDLLQFNYRQQPFPEFIWHYPEHKPVLPDYQETGTSGLYQLKRMFGKCQLSKKGLLDQTIRESEWALDLMLFDELRLGLEPGLQALYSCRTFEEFELGALQSLGVAFDQALVAGVNARVSQFYAAHAASGSNPVESRQVLTREQLEHWQEHGFLVIPNVLDKGLCERACQMLYDFLEMQPDKPDTWYRMTGKMQKIMVQLFEHPLQDEIRNTPAIRAIFEDLWQTDRLWMSTDRMGFNPPENPAWQFPGPDLHWDLDFSKPIAFGTQGLLYLADVAADQGAFCCVPGFHRKIDTWLKSLPEGADPQDQDWRLWDVKPIAAEAGSLIVWHQALPHGSSPNRASRPRLVQYLNMRPLR
ncbi:phytanoyl-CoA dioxygenase family protein [Shewanella sedimentimangrovi]|uniref:Phytanoyl-CoA dioxygenase family protein n=1 Tax=Shewanella sedimentimangrovi TaxID=2814293 RepID=A0ABX7R0U4_9GAMM|nr:phytanoyl-CoA dioxygenase family protein [Shewanella sedimentimangrovi]QSX37412.1 phytanoyl-CoA dioxygenase family protein [Shewanella sedimentimangrovi]